jgi:ribosome-binding protein aMBF1 (putative translation factor)
LQKAIRQRTKVATSWNELKAQRPQSVERELGYGSARRLHETGSAVRKLRQDAGLSQRDVCARAGIGTSTLSRLESGEAMPGIDVLARISEVLGARLELSIVPVPAA